MSCIDHTPPHPTPDKEVICNRCEWKGKNKDLRNEYYKSDYESWRALAGREGTLYKCPKCGKELDSKYDRRS